MNLEILAATWSYYSHIILEHKLLPKYNIAKDFTAKA